MKGLSAGIKVGILVIIMVVGSYAVWKAIDSDPAGSDNYALWAKFRDASGLPIGSKVVVAGLPVGEITGLSIEGQHARVAFKIRDDIQVWSSGVVFKKATSLLGDQYLEVDPGEAQGKAADGTTVENTLLGDGDQVPRVVEATSADQVLRHSEDALGKIDAVLLSVKDLADDLRRIVNGPVQSIASRVDDLVQSESGTVKDILARVNASVARIDLITKDIRGVTGGADARVNAILDNLDAAASEARGLVDSAKDQVELTGTKVRAKLDLLDDVIEHTASITSKIDDDRGTLGRLVNDGAIADNVEEITHDAKGFLGTLFGLQTYVGLRSEYNVFAGLARHYLSVELYTRPDKYYLIELEKGPRGDYPVVSLEFDPLVSDDTWVRRTTIEDRFRFTFQFAKRIRWLTVRYGIKESTGGFGLDADFELPWWGRDLKFSMDLFDATFDQLPRLKIAAALEVFHGVYILGGVDELLNNPDELDIDTGGSDVPIQFEKFHFGRDYFAGAMLRFNDADLAALLTVGGSALAGAGGSD